MLLYVITDIQSISSLRVSVHLCWVRTKFCRSQKNGMLKVNNTWL